MNKIEDYVYEIPNWIDYEPLDDQYGIYDSNIIVSMHKIGDVYDNFCRARALLIDVDNVENGNNISNLYLKSALLLSALMHYETCIDLSYQVIWFRYIENDNIKLITNKKHLSKQLRKCNYISLKKNLEEKGYQEIIEYIDSITSRHLWKKIHSLYNYYKHKGSLHIEGIGKNPQYSMIMIGEKRPHILYRKEFNVDEWTELLIRFNGEFINYFNEIIKKILPDKDVSLNFFEVIDKMKRYI